MSGEPQFAQEVHVAGSVAPHDGHALSVAAPGGAGDVTDAGGCATGRAEGGGAVRDVPPLRRPGPSGRLSLAAQ